MGFHWPTDPPGHSNHTISWQTHQQHRQQAGLSRPAPQKGRVVQGVTAGTAGAPGGPPAAPAPPPPPPKPPVFVPDAAYNNAVALAGQAYNNAVGDIGKAETKAKFDYGFDDPSNPFSKVNELKRDYLNQSHYIGNSLGARGQLYSTARTKALANNSRAQDKDYAALREVYQNALDTLASQRRQAKLDRSSAATQALADAMAREGVA